MKTLFSSSMIVLLLLCANGIQAQTTQTKLNQVELIKQFIGNWKVEIGKDTTAFYDIKPYGTGLDCNFKHVTKGKIFVEGKELWGYDKASDKMIVAYEGMDMELLVLWFTSKSKCVFILYKDISNPEKASFKLDTEFKSPDMYLQTKLVNDKPVLNLTYKRIK